MQYVVGCHDFRNLCKMDVANGVVKYDRRILSAKVKVFATDPFCNSADTASGLLPFNIFILLLYRETSLLQNICFVCSGLTSVMKIFWGIVPWHQFYIVLAIRYEISSIKSQDLNKVPRN